MTFDLLKKPQNHIGKIVATYLLVSFAYAQGAPIQSFRLVRPEDYWYLNHLPFLYALILPLLWLPGLFLLLPRFGKGFVPRYRKNLPLLFLPFLPALIAPFSPGSLGPEASQILCAGLFFLGLRKRSFLSVLPLSFFVLLSLLPRDIPSWSFSFFIANLSLPLFSLFSERRLLFKKRARLLYSFAFLSLAASFFFPAYAFLPQLFCAPLLARSFVRFGKKLSRLPESRKKYTKEFFLFLALTFLPASILPACLRQAPLVPNVLFTPAVPVPTACDLKSFSDFLFADDSDKAFILNQPQDGPELSYRTPLTVSDVSYETETNLSDSFFEASDAKAQEILERNNVKYVLFCKHRAGRGHMFSRLSQGKPPAFLRKIKLPFNDTYWVYESTLWQPPK